MKNQVHVAGVAPKAAADRERPLPELEKVSAYIRSRIASTRDEDLCALFLIDVRSSEAEQEHTVRRAAGVLAAQFRASDIVARHAPEQLLAFVSGRLTEQSVRQKAGELHAALQREGVDAHIGVCLTPGRDMNLDEMCSEALNALRQCCTAGHDPVCVHTLSNWIESHLLSPSGLLSAGTLLDSISEGVRLLKAGQTLQPFYASPGFYHLLSLEEQIDCPLLLRVHPSDEQIYQRAARQTIDSGEPAECTVRMGDESGQVHCRVHLSRLFQTGGGTPILLEITQSADELFTQTAQAQKNSEWLRMLLKQTDCQLWSVDLSSRMMYILEAGDDNGPQQQLFRDFPEAFIECGRVHPDSIRQFKKFAQNLLSGCANDSANFILQYRQTSCYGWSAVSYRMLYDEDGRPAEAVGIREDLSYTPTRSDLSVPGCPLSADLLPRLLGFLRVNLTQNQVESLYLEGRDRTWMSRFKNYDDTISLLRAQIFAKDDEPALSALFDREALLNAFVQGKRWISSRFRSVDTRGGIQWLSAHIHLRRSPAGEDVWMDAYFKSIEHLHRCEVMLEQPPVRDPVTALYELATMQAVVRTLTGGQETQPRALAVICTAGLEEAAPDDSPQSRQLRADMAAALSVALGPDSVIGQYSSDTVIAFLSQAGSVSSTRDRLSRAVLFVRQSLADLPAMKSLRFIVSAACEDMGFTEYSAVLSGLLADCDRRRDAHTDVIEFPSRPVLLQNTPPQPSVPDDEIPQPLPLCGELNNEEKDAALECISAMLRAGSRDASLNAVLEHIGRYYRADRAYILSVNANDQSLSVPYEWNSEALHGMQKVIAGRRLRHFPLFLRHIRSDAPLYLPPLPRGQEQPTGGAVCQFAVFPLCRADKSQRVLFLENPRRHPAGTALLSYLVPYIEQEWDRFQKLPGKFVSDLDRLMNIPNLRSFTSAVRSFNSDLYNSMGAVAVDIPSLTAINDEAGFACGTRLLLRLSEILTEVFGSDLLFHTKQSEFVVLSPNTIYELFTERCRRVRMLLDGLDAQQFRIGYAWSDGVFGARELVREAQMMMSCNNIPSSVSSAYVSRGSSALSGRFTIFLQPKVDMRTGTLVGAEALARLVDQGKTVSIGDVVEQMEQDGTIRELDYFVFDQVLSLLSRWQAEDLKIVPISANFSRFTLLNSSCPASVLAILSRYTDVPQGMVEIELTETACHIESSTLTALMDRIRQFGPRFSLDDFGSHYSNAAVLTRVHFDSVKIDRSLTSGIVSNPVSQMLVRNIVQICQSCGMTCIAEGVETRAQIDALLREGCELCQGYYFAKPMSVQAFEERYLLHSHKI